MSEHLKTGLIIAGIYLLVVLYLIFVSYRVDMLDNGSDNNNIVATITNN